MDIMSSLVVDLSPVAGPVFSGRDRGEALREKYGLDALDTAAEVDVVIPESIWTVSSSFFLGMFGPSVRKCGSVDSFERKYRFKAPEFLKPILHSHATLALQPRALLK